MHRYYLLIITIILLAFNGCVSGQSDSNSSGPTGLKVTQPAIPESTTGNSPSELVPRISKEDLLKKINSNSDILIVDSRADVEQEFEMGHIKGAIPVTLNQVISGQWIPPADKNKEIIFYCT